MRLSQAMWRMQIKEAHWLQPMGFWGEKQAISNGRFHPSMIWQSSVRRVEIWRF
jgi:hypothetical protein